MFNLHGIEKLAAWRQFRDSIESSETPFEDVISLWCRAPFVNRYLNHKNPNSWPDPWQLVLDGKFDDLGLALAMLYTIKLTERFSQAACEIYTSLSLKNQKTSFVVVIDNQTVLNLDYKEITTLFLLKKNNKVNKLWTSQSFH